VAKVLVVDDEHSQVEVLTMLLNSEGFEVAAAFNGRDALDMLQSVKPDLIVTDFMMPVMNGGEMAKLIRASPHSSVRIIMTSATESHFVEQQSQHHDGFLRKPYLWDDLFAMIARLLREIPDDRTFSPPTK
jgi:two-component system response regulator VicR